MSLERWFFLRSLPVHQQSSEIIDGRRERKAREKKFIIKEATRLRTFALLKVLIETLTFQSNGSKMIQSERLGRWDVVEEMDGFIRSWKWMDFGGRVGWISLEIIIWDHCFEVKHWESFSRSFSREKKFVGSLSKNSMLVLNLISKHFNTVGSETTLC